MKIGIISWIPIMLGNSQFSDHPKANYHLAEHIWHISAAFSASRPSDGTNVHHF